LRPGSPFPSINDLKEAWIAWKASHPEKIAREYEEEFCSECGGKGYFEVVYEVVPSRFGLIEYTTILPCAKCRNWKKVFGEKPRKLWTREEIEKHPTFYLKDKRHIAGRAKQVEEEQELCTEAYVPL